MEKIIVMIQQLGPPMFFITFTSIESLCGLFFATTCLTSLSLLVVMSQRYL